MKKLTILTITFILSQIFAQALIVSICMASDGGKSGFLSGSAWMDNNTNSIQELGEDNMACVIVFVKNEDTGKLATAKTDASGYYTMTNLSYGRYTIWSESVTGATTTAQMIELNEVNGATMLDVAFTPATTQTIVNIYLPVVNNWAFANIFIE